MTVEEMRRAIRGMRRMASSFADTMQDLDDELDAHGLTDWALGFAEDARRDLARFANPSEFEWAAENFRRWQEFLNAIAPERAELASQPGPNPAVRLSPQAPPTAKPEQED
jgi:hypothetical protein